jgi:hypothetical protein
MAAGLNGWTAVLTVPAGKRWSLSAWYIYQSTGDNKIVTVGVRPPPATAELVALKRFASTTTNYVFLEKVVVLDEYWTVEINTDGTGSAESAFTGKFLYEEEDSF